MLFYGTAWYNQLMRSNKPKGFNAARFTRGSEAQMVVGFFVLLYFVLLYLVGGALIWLFYGAYGAMLGLSCITVGLLFSLLLYAIVSLLGRWAGE